MSPIHPDRRRGRPVARLRSPSEGDARRWTRALGEAERGRPQHLRSLLAARPRRPLPI
ncbi:hypothetical protein LNKW23_11840 [Paralimibaculum aggregatum]|uniref:Uncharacterized protein n=1 Tax=Paralimibaculum aggregatum TaxID=3036245 RepID=A0ABQ6LHR1_9RHOB|nr:hypothetical protein [Limibaculum sp. NKW23]GMG81971.1 hypothetical protein LNKW23_11840 [Limibaculum sp. NKW23]